LNYRFTALRVLTPVLVCCAARALLAQQTDQDQSPPPIVNPWNDPLESLVSTSSVPLDLPYTPLGLGQKYLFTLNEVVGPGQWVGFAIHAGLDQFRRTPEGWGNDTSSFGVRMANHFGQTFLRQNIAFGVRAFDHEDPRYFRLEKGTTWQRTKYALSRTLIARNDDGRWMPAYSRLVADFTTPFIAQAWRPDKFSVARGFRGASAGIGLGFGSNVFQEFWPDLKKKFWKRSRGSPDPSVVDPGLSALSIP
jgi:hypothetical protein